LVTSFTRLSLDTRPMGRKRSWVVLEAGALEKIIYAVGEKTLRVFELTETIKQYAYRNK